MSYDEFVELVGQMRVAQEVMWNSIGQLESAKRLQHLVDAEIKRHGVVEGERRFGDEP